MTYCKYKNVFNYYTIMTEAAISPKACDYTDSFYSIICFHVVKECKWRQFLATNNAWQARKRGVISPTRCGGGAVHRFLLLPSVNEGCESRTVSRTLNTKIELVERENDNIVRRTGNVTKLRRNNAEIIKPWAWKWTGTFSSMRQPLQGC